MVMEKYKFTRLKLFAADIKEKKKKKREIKTIHIFVGFFFLLNFCVGTGFLGIPFTFFSSGLLAGIPTLVLVGFVSWLNATWLLECMARAQVCIHIMS